MQVVWHEGVILHSAQQAGVAQRGSAQAKGECRGRAAGDAGACAVAPVQTGHADGLGLGPGTPI